MASQMQPQVPMPQQQASGGQQQAQAQPQQNDPDPISRFKSLLPRLREALGNLFKDAALVFRHNAACDSGSQVDTQQRERMDKLDKRLEDFFAICDQIEISLRLALELHHQATDSMRNTPQSVMISKPDPSASQQEGQSYAQYLTTMRGQINFAKDLHDVLLDCGSKLLEKSQPPPPPPPPQSLAQQQQQPPSSQQQQQQQQE